MDYEKKYKEALELARIWKDKSGMPKDKQGILDDIFPELKESEDERIRKGIIKYLSWIKDRDGSYMPNNIPFDKMLAWLEKQGENDSNKMSIWKHWKDGIAGNGEGKPIYLIKDGDAYRISSVLGCECDYIELSELDKLLSEKQAEQKANYTTIVETGDGRINALVTRDIEIPFGAKDSELQEVTYYIPKGFYAKIEDDKVVIKKGEKPTAWSEEDEERIKNIISVLDWDGTTGKKGNPYQKEIDWLKSLKERYTWKPSDEQMKALKHASNDCSIAFADMKILATLYEQLKALHRYEQNT